MVLFLIIKIVNSSTTNFLKSIREASLKSIQMFSKIGHILVRCYFTNTTDEALLSFYIVTAQEQPARLYF